MLVSVIIGRPYWFKYELLLNISGMLTKQGEKDHLHSTGESSDDFTQLYLVYAR